MKLKRVLLCLVGAFSVLSADTFNVNLTTSNCTDTTNCGSSPAGTIDFGTVAVGSFVTHTIVVKNTSEQALNNYSEYGSNYGTEYVEISDTCTVSLDANATCTIEIKFAPTTIGTHNSNYENKYFNDSGWAAQTNVTNIRPSFRINFLGVAEPSHIDLNISLQNTNLSEHNITNIQIFGVDGNEENLSIPNLASTILDGENNWTVPIFNFDQNFTIRFDENLSETLSIDWFYNFADGKLYPDNNGSSEFKQEINSTNNNFTIDLSAINWRYYNFSGNLLENDKNVTDLILISTLNSEVLEYNLTSNYFEFNISETAAYFLALVTDSNQSWYYDFSTGDINYTHITPVTISESNSIDLNVSYMRFSDYIPINSTNLNISLNIIESPAHLSLTDISLIDLRVDENESNSSFGTFAKFYKNIDSGMDRYFAISIEDNNSDIWLYSDTNLTLLSEVSFDSSLDFNSTYGFSFDENITSKDLNLSSSKFGYMELNSSTDLNIDLNILESPTHLSLTDISLIDLRVDENESNSSFGTFAKFYKSVDSGMDRYFAISIEDNNSDIWLYSDTNLTLLSEVSFDSSLDFNSTYGFSFDENITSKDLNLSSLRFSDYVEPITCQNSGVGCPICIGEQFLTYDINGSGVCTNPTCLDSEKLIDGVCVAKTCADDNYNCIVVAQTVTSESGFNIETPTDFTVEDDTVKDSQVISNSIKLSEGLNSNIEMSIPNSEGEALKLNLSIIDDESGKSVSESKFESKFKDLNVKFNSDGSISAKFKTDSKEEEISTEQEIDIKNTGEIEGKISIQKESTPLKREFKLPANSNFKINSDGSIEAKIYIGEQSLDRAVGSNASYSERSRFQLIMQAFPNGEFGAKVIDLNSLTRTKRGLNQGLVTTSYSAREEFFNVSLEVVLEGSLNATFETSSNFTYSNYSLNRDLTTPKSVEIIPMSQWQRFEEVDNFDGTRSIKLLLGEADIVIDSQRESMEKNILYPLPSSEVEKIEIELDIDSNLESPIYKNRELKLIEGWNLIANPVDRELDISLFQSPIIWTYQDKIWIQNPPKIYPKFGYWIKSDFNQSILIEGESYSLDLNNSLIDGWTLVGVGENISKEELNLDTIYSFYNDIWSLNPKNLYRAQGVWVK